MSVGELLAREGFKPQSWQAGRTYKLRCPHCNGGRTREISCNVTVDQEGTGATWLCHRGTCGWTGGVSEPKHDDRGRDADRSRKRKRPVVRPEPEKDPKKPAALYDWWAQRGISRETVDAFGIYITTRRFEQIGDTWCIVFPYVKGGQLVNRKYRPPQKTPQLQDANAEATLFNIDAVEADDIVYFVEGEPDVLAMWEAGYRQVVTLPNGAPAKLRDENDPARKDDARFEALESCGERLAKIDRVILAGDNDEPGQNLREELARRLGREKCWIVSWPDGCKDCNDTLIKHGADGVRAAIESAKPYPVEGLHQIDALAVLALRREHKTTLHSTGWPSVDRDLFQVPDDGRLWVVTGPPNSGKSEWVDALLVNLATTLGWRTAYFSPENAPIEQHAAKLVEKYIGQPYYGYGDRPAMSDAAVISGAEWVKERFSWIVSDNPAEDRAPSLDYVLDKARIAIARFGCKVVVIDPWNELEHARPRHMTEAEYLNASLSRLRRFRRAHGVHVVIVAHPVKITQDPRSSDKGPKVVGPYDISGGAGWFNKADIGLTVHRPSADPKDNVVELHCWKMRFKRDGRKGKIDYSWDRDTGRYRDFFDTDREKTPLHGADGGVYF